MDTESTPDRPNLWRRSPGLIFHLATVAVALETLYLASLPGTTDLEPLVLALGLWAAMGLAWLLRGIGYLATRAHRSGARGVLAWLVAPALFLSSGILSVYDVPFRLRFELNRAELDAFARSVRSGTFEKPNRVGSFPIYHQTIVHSDDEVFFAVRGAGFFSSVGLINAPSQPEVPDRDRLNDLGSGWWMWETTDSD